MSLKNLLLSVLLSAILLLSGAVVSMDHTGYDGATREGGGVIRIDSDEDLEDMADLRGWSGDGSSSDPYMIEDMEIDGNGSSHCIFIGNTTHHLVIKDCLVYGVREAAGIPSGILLFNASRITLVNVTFRDNGDDDGVGLWIHQSNNVTVRDSYFADNGKGGEASVGIYIDTSEYVFVFNCEMTTDVNTEIAFGIYAESSNNLLMSDLVLHNNTATSQGGGIYLDRVMYCTIRDCSISDNIGMRSYGIISEGSERISISDSSFARNQNGTFISYGIHLLGSFNNTIDGCHFLDQGHGISLMNSNGNDLMNNHIQGHFQGLYLYYADDNRIENNTILDTDEINFGSCPFLYTWNGEDMELIGDVNGMGGLGYSFDMTISGGEPFERREPTSLDYTKIDGSELQAVDGSYLLELVEEQDEITYFDEAELWVIDHPSDVEIYNPEAALCTFEPDLFEPVIHTVKDPVQPQSATDWNGDDILDVISKADETYTDAKVLNDNFITLDLGDLSDAEQIKLIYRAYTDWSPIGELKENVYAEVIGSDGSWELVSEKEHLGKPEALPRTWVMDITDWFRTDDYRLRLHTGNIKIHIDWIAVDTSLDAPVEVKVLEPTSAYHYFKGPTHSTFENFEGDFTRYGNVLPLLESTDDKFVIMKDGDAVKLRFKEQEPPLQDRDFLLVTDAYFKQPFVKYLLGEPTSSVYPLPFHEMSNYPYSEDENYPDDPDHLAYIEEWNTRHVETDLRYGMSLPFSDNNTVYDNYIQGGIDANLLYINSETNCSIIGNELYGGRRGLVVLDSSHVEVRDNIVMENNHTGISIYSSEDVELTENMVVDNNQTGILMRHSSNIRVFNNHFDNPENWNISDVTDVEWNTTITPGENILGGRYIAGNFWSDYSGTDLNGDMIGDTLVPHGPGDMLPLTFEEIHPTIEDTTVGGPTTGDPFTFSAEVSDLGGIGGVYLEYWFGSGPHENISMTGSEGYPYIGTIPLPDDAVEVSYVISAVDLSANWVDTGHRNLTVLDDDVPMLSNLTIPAQMGIGENALITVRITDNIGIETVRMTYMLPNEDGKELNYTIDGDFYSAVLPAYGMKGWMNISVLAVDTSGNMNSTDTSLSIVDDIPPEIEILNPSAGTFVSGQVGIAVNITDAGEGVDRAVIEISGVVIFDAEVGDTMPLILIWNTTDQIDGQHVILVRAWDLAGNEANHTIEVTVKNNFSSDEELRIVSSSPMDQDTDVPVDVVVEMVFTVPVDIDRFFLTATGTPEYTITWMDNDTIMKMTFVENLSYDTMYTIWIDSAYSRIAAPLLGTPYDITFTTESNISGDDDDDDIVDDDDDDDIVDDDDDDDDDTGDDDDSESKGSQIAIAAILIIIILLLLIVVVVLVIRKASSGAGFEDEE